jgi:hypothetical protein
VRRILPAIFFVAVATGTVLFFLLRSDPPPAGPPEASTTPSADARPPSETRPPQADAGTRPATRVDPSTGYPALKPGEVVPGTRPDTLIVQPMQPGPPKEIKRHYTVPTPEEDPRIDRTEDGKLLFNQPIEMARQLHDPASAPFEDLQILDGVLRYYKLMYRQNPVGENFEIMRALMGENQHQMVVFPPDHPSLNAAGELVDRWGNPYFFHSISAEVMDIQSAGPDGKIGSIDDLSLGHEFEGGTFDSIVR